MRLKRWIDEVVQSQLESAHEFLRRGYLPKDDSQTQDDICTADLVRIGFTSQRRTEVQILEFLTKKDPIHAILSDSVSMVRAEFSKGATKAFELASGRKFTDRTIGGVLNLEEYNIVAVASQKVILNISRFGLEGLLGSPPIGNPTKLEEVSGVRNIMRKWDQLGDERPRPRRSLNFPNMANNISSTQSQIPAQGNPRSPDSAHATQVFVTQAPLRLPQIQQHHSNSQLDFINILHEGVSKLAKTVPTTIADKGHSGIHEQTAELDHSITLQKDNIQSPIPTATSSTCSTDELEHSEKVIVLDIESPTEQESTEAKVDFATTDHKLQSKSATSPLPFEGMKRIPRSFVRIPESQKILLERNDAWAKIESDGYVQGANIPNDVIAELKKFVSRISTKADDVAKVTSPSHKKHTGVRFENEGTSVPLREEWSGFKQCLESKETTETFGDSNANDDDVDSFASWSPTPPRVLQNLAPDDGDLSDDNSVIIPPSSLKTAISITANSHHFSFADIAPSSPHENDDLPVDVTHVIGEEICDPGDDTAERPSTLADVPSTLPRKEPTIQVKRTPYQASRMPSTSFGSESNGMENARHDSEDHEPQPSSDHMIPGTFEDRVDRQHEPANSTIYYDGNRVVDINNQNVCTKLTLECSHNGSGYLKRSAASRHEGSPLRGDSPVKRRKLVAAKSTYTSGSSSEEEAQPTVDVSEFIRALRYKYKPRDSSTHAPPIGSDMENDEDEPQPSMSSATIRELGAFSPVTSYKSRAIVMRTTSSQYAVDKAFVSQNTLTAYEKFKIVYPNYNGSQKSFGRALAYLDFLGQSGKKKFLRRNLWDDFIRALNSNYLEHVREARVHGRRIMSGYEFYNDQDDEPIFKNMVITPDNLQDSLDSLDQDVVAVAKALFQGSGRTANSSLAQASTVSTPSHISGREAEAGDNTSHFALYNRDTGQSVTPVYPYDEGHDTSKDLKKRRFFEAQSQIQNNILDRSGARVRTENCDELTVEPVQSVEAVAETDNFTAEPLPTATSRTLDRSVPNSVEMDLLNPPTGASGIAIYGHEVKVPNHDVTSGHKEASPILGEHASTPSTQNNTTSRIMPRPISHPSRRRTTGGPCTPIGVKPSNTVNSLREWIANSAAMQELKRKRESRGFLTPDGKRVSKEVIGKRRSMG